MITITCPDKSPKWIKAMVAALNSNFGTVGGGGYDGNPTTIVQDATHRFATDAEKLTWNGKQDALGFTPSNVGHTHTQSDIANLATDLANKSSVGHGHNQSDVANLVSDLAAKAPLASPAFTGTPTGITKTHVGLGNVDNTADADKPVSTAQQTALNGKANSSHTHAQSEVTNLVNDLAGKAASSHSHAQSEITNLVTDLAAKAALTVLDALSSVYRTLLHVAGSHTAARVAGTYALGYADVAPASGAGTLYPLGTIYIDSADYPIINGKTPKLRIRAQLYTNDVAPTGNFTFGLYPITRPATSGGAGLDIFTLGTVVAGSNGATFTAPSADGLLQAVGADFALPANGHYVIGVVTTATVAASSHVHLQAQLQLHHN